MNDLDKFKIILEDLEKTLFMKGRFTWVEHDYFISMSCCGRKVGLVTHYEINSNFEVHVQRLFAAVQQYSIWEN